MDNIKLTQGELYFWEECYKTAIRAGLAAPRGAADVAVTERRKRYTERTKDEPKTDKMAAARAAKQKKAKEKAEPAESSPTP